MGLLENIAGMAGDASKKNEDSTFLTVVMQVIDKNFGGLGGFMQSLNQSGLGDIVSSWVGKGENKKSISEGEVVRGVGIESIHEISGKTGITEDGVVSKLTQLLPDFVSKLTPDGILPRGNIMDIASKYLNKK